MKPHPIPENQICSECGLSWYLHPENPRRRDCIRLLKVELLSRPIAPQWDYTIWFQNTDRTISNPPLPQVVVYDPQPSDINTPQL